MDDDASANTHANDVVANGQAVNAHSADMVDANALDRETSEVLDQQAAEDVADQIEEDQPIHVPLGT